MADNINDILRAKRLVRQAGYRVERPTMERPTSRFNHSTETEELDRPRSRFDRPERTSRFDREERNSRFDRPAHSSRFDRFRDREPEEVEDRPTRTRPSFRNRDDMDAPRNSRILPRRRAEEDNTPEDSQLSDRMRLIKAKQIVKAAGYTYQKFNTGVDDTPPTEPVANDGVNPAPANTQPPETPARRVRPSAPSPEIEVVPGNNPTPTPEQTPKRKSAEEYYQELAAKYV